MYLQQQLHALGKERNKDKKSIFPRDNIMNNMSPCHTIAWASSPEALGQVGDALLVKVGKLEVPYW